MTSRPRIAAVLLTESCDPNCRIAGLPVDERLMLALHHGGIQQVVFLGGGRVPHSQRAPLTILDPADVDLAPGDTFVLLPADLVFDRGLLAKDPRDIPKAAALRVLPAARWSDVRDRPDKWLRTLGPGHVPHPQRQDFALRVTSRATARQASRALYRSLVKPIDGLVSRHLNRKISVALTRLLVKTPLRPNTLTLFISALGLLSGVAAFFPEVPLALVLAGVLFQTQSILDGCDGELARLRFQFSTRGQWLDTIGDDLTNYAFCLGLGLGQARVLDAPWLVAAALVVLLFQLWSSGIMYQRIYKMKTGDLLALPNLVSSGPPKGLPGKLLRWIHTLSKRDTFVLVTAVITAAGYPLVAFGIIGVGSIFMAPSLTLNEIRIRRALRDGTLQLP
ncbi:MAG: CDP-alcohol phosphatidyltransferase family protein [Myxococcales bacterium]|jgi:phosphatidylglycerophosphate synthase|nr:CDP-alcohol phosphatidyltransferase family protein [Myxococcales bacterium]